ncbi:hypothetical protein J7I98_11895 [Streptomyces sp. ISL-98]|uniref:hypothetical protein n=1 Tax=Streptomyces sp. ISL-98 TaxID=2819192 RepID=UPI001BEA4C09|nr:hypothetical protein [Streptomyces sp. ISL-98]MBT2506585.1 hypothetical protein [Streptomyces sp. ISL-98]
MFSRKKIAAVSGLLGSLAVTCTCGIQAYAAGPQSNCTVDNQGNTTCIQRTLSTPEGDGFVVRQTQSCVPLQPLSLPVIGLVNKGKKRIGPEVTCAPNTTAPDNSDDSRELPGLLG